MAVRRGVYPHHVWEPGMNRKEISERVLTYKAIADFVKQHDSTDRQALVEAFQTGDGADRISINDGDIRLGQITYSAGRKVPLIDDAAALLSWVKENHPHEVQTVEVIRPAFLAYLKGIVKKHKAAVTDDGEVIPGMRFERGDPFVTATMTEEGRERVRLNLGLALPELTGGE